jgi:hypothetical protein
MAPSASDCQRGPCFKLFSLLSVPNVFAIRREYRNFVTVCLYNDKSDIQRPQRFVSMNVFHALPGFICRIKEYKTRLHRRQSASQCIYVAYDFTAISNNSSRYSNFKRMKSVRAAMQPSIVPAPIFGQALDPLQVTSHKNRCILCTLWMDSMPLANAED